MTFADQNIYSRIFQQVVHKGGESAINLIIIFQNSQALKFSVGNSYTKDQLTQKFLRQFPARKKIISPDRNPPSIIDMRRNINGSKIITYI